MQFSEVSIVTPTALYVQMQEAQNAPVKSRCVSNAVKSPAMPSVRKCGHWAVILRTAGKRGDPYVFPPCAGASGVMCCARLN